MTTAAAATPITDTTRSLDSPIIHYFLVESTVQVENVPRSFCAPSGKTMYFFPFTALRITALAAITELERELDGDTIGTRQQERHLRLDHMYL